jgi:hypothetical protein
MFIPPFIRTILADGFMKRVFNASSPAIPVARIITPERAIA